MAEVAPIAAIPIEDAKLISVVLRNQQNQISSKTTVIEEDITTRSGGDRFDASVYDVKVNGMWQGLGFLSCGIRFPDDNSITIQRIAYFGNITISSYVILDGTTPVPYNISSYYDLVTTDGWLFLRLLHPTGIQYVQINMCFRRT